MKFFVFASLLTAGVFASKCHPQYECCSGCDVFYSDNEALWGVENGNWCVIQNSVCGGNKATDYPNCNSCDVYYIDATGKWGVENRNWCIIQESRCGTSNVSNATYDNVNTPATGGGVNPIPVIHLKSSSGNSDFATKPVEKHIADQAYMGGNKPPEPYNEECVITIEDTDGTKAVNGVNGKVKVRGNWTSNYPKKSLKISFDDSQSVLGLNGGKKFKNWVLLAEYKDGSMLRNKASFALSRSILGPDGLYASDSQLVELKINDEYFGVYLLAENQQINEGRVSITKAKDDYQGTDIGYFLEFDTGYSRYEDKIDSLIVDFNNNAPLKPYDGNGGSGKTIEPSGGSGGGFGGFGGFGGWNQQPQQNNQPQQQNNQPQPQQNNQWGQQNNQPQPQQNNQWGQQNNQPQQQQNNQWNQQNNQPQQQQNNPQQNAWGGFGNQNQNNGQQNNQWGGFGGFGNWGNNMKKRQFGGGSAENMSIKSGANSQEQHDFISKYINNVYKILYEAAYNKKALAFTSDYTDVVEATGKTPKEAIESVIDANSLADLFIISEMTCDADLYYSSFYMDVDFGANGSKKLRFEAAWDFDSGLGNRDRCPDGKGHYAANIMPDNNGFGSKINPWLAVIIYEDWFQDIIKSKWSKAYDSGVFGRVVDMIHSDTKIAEAAFTRNYEKWNNLVDKHGFDNELSPGARQCTTQAQASEYLAKWFENRVAFINSNWHE